MCKFTLLGINELYFILENELRRHNYVWSYFDSPSRLPTEMSAPIKPKTKGRKGKPADGAPSSVQAQATSKPQMLQNAASPSPQTPSAPVYGQGNSMAVPASAGLGGSLSTEQVI